jgi:hypothetical protein
VELDDSSFITGLLVASLAILAMIFLIRKKYDSNLPLLFYFVAIIFTNMSTKMTVNPYLMITGLALAMILRFEFMSQGFAKMIAYLATGALGLIVYVFMVEIFGSGQAPF